MSIARFNDNSQAGLKRFAANELNYYLKAATPLGYPDAQFGLDEIYERGRGVKRYKAAALSWYRLASQQGHKEGKTKSLTIR